MSPALSGKWATLGAGGHRALRPAVRNPAGEEDGDVAVHRSVTQPTPRPAKGPGMVSNWVTG